MGANKNVLSLLLFISLHIIVMHAYSRSRTFLLRDFLLKEVNGLDIRYALLTSFDFLGSVVGDGHDNALGSMHVHLDDADLKTALPTAESSGKIQGA